ncbi:MAG: molybdopterin-dependent oxidoreductase, partial [Spirochaeta sp.]|jgi:aldehyde oxidoreductase|nr:molybdopterin-dependent oxidoreductase [Spirochaeta sp.]
VAVSTIDSTGQGAIQCGFCTPAMVLSTIALLRENADPTEAQIRSALDPVLCRCTGYASIVRAVTRAAAIERGETPQSDASPIRFVPAAASRPDRAIVGSSVLRVDAVAKVTGAPVFADDQRAPGTLYGALAFGDADHAYLTTVDTSAAEEAPGVVRVLTAADIPGRNGFGLFVPHQPVIAEREIRWRGEPVAVVVAHSPEEARRAARLISVVSDPLPVLHDPIEALAPGASALHDGGNTAETVRFRRGDPEHAFATADLVIEGVYETQPVEHAYLEPESCLAVPEGDDGNGHPQRLVIYTANQGSGAFRSMIAASLAIPEERVRVVYTPAGGGFGGKEEPTVQIHAALATWLIGVPVRITLDRTDSLRVSTKRHAARIEIAHAVRADGTLLAVRTRTVCDAGAYLSLTKPVVFRTAVMAGGPYVVPNADVESLGVYTNTNPSGAFRGFGSTQISFAVEVQMNRIAAALGIDPVDLRRRNALATGLLSATGHRLGEGVGYRETLEAVAEAIERERQAIAAEHEGASDADTPTPLIGIGIASAYKNVGIGKGLPDEASAAVEREPDGTYTVYVGATDMGQGSDTTMAQIAAEVLEVPFDRVRVVSSDTDRCPDAGMTTASRQTFISGNAVAGAARELRAQLAAQPTDTANSPEPVRVEFRYRPPETVHLPEEINDAEAPSPDGFPIHFSYCFTTMAAIIEVNPDGSDLKVRKLITAQDVGRAIHPQNVLGQTEGAAVMGYGYAVREKYESGRNGRTTATLNQIGVPRFSDAPELESYIVEVTDPNGPYGAKGIGEVPLNPAAPAIASAIHDALGVWPTRLPIAPNGTVEALSQPRLPR